MAHPTPNYPAMSWVDSFQKVILTSFGLAPLFVVTVRSWSSALLILGALFSIAFLLRPQNKPAPAPHALQPLIVLTLLSPVIAIAFSSLLHGKYQWSDYDSSSRFLLAIAIFLFAFRQQFNSVRLLQYTAPLSLVFTLLDQIYLPTPRLWTESRMATYFADPLVFGYTSLTLGLMSLVSINLLTRDSKPVIAFKLIGTGIGFYLSVMSGSRTGWLAVPLVIGIWIFRQHLVKGKRWAPWILGTTALLALGLLTLSPIVNQRLLIAFQEISTYPWTGLAPETSVGLRITFLRIAFDMFTSQPFTGFGDTRNLLTPLPNHVYTYATPESIRVALMAGFHNEVVTNAIRSGMAGMLSSLMLFLAPLFVFMRQLRNSSPTQQAHAMMGLVFTLCIFISSFSTEVLDLKYCASFYSLMIALLCAGALTPEKGRSHG